MSIWYKLYFLFLLLSIYSYGRAAVKGGPALILIVLGYCLAVAGTSAIALYYIYFSQHRNNLFIFHFFTPVEYILLTWLYVKELRHPLVRRCVVLSIPAFVVLSVIFSMYVQPLSINNSDIVIIESILLCTWALLFLRELIIFQQTESPSRIPLFWISVGILFYFIGNLFVEGLLNYLMRHSMDSARAFYNFGFIFKYIFFLMLLIAVYCQGYGKKDNGNQ